MEKSKLYFYPYPHTSISALQSFYNCPMSFYLKYICKVKIPPPDRVLFGRQFQEVLNEKYKGENPDAQIEMMPANKRGLARLMYMKSKDFENIKEVDKLMDVDLGFDIPFKFAVDLLLEDTIVENKVTGGYYNEKMVHKEKQATLYYAAIKKLYGFDPKIKYQIFNTRKKNVEIVNTKRTQAQVDFLYDWIDKTLKKIKYAYDTDRWTTTEHSPFPCDFAHLCPWYKEKKK
jgi:CRISPR/Cas system-associated exonuclease Cas4 (RecB family)